MDSEKGAKSGGNEGDTDRQRSLTPPLNAAIILALFEAEVQEKKLARKVVGLQGTDYFSRRRRGLWLERLAAICDSGVRWRRRISSQRCIAGVADVPGSIAFFPRRTSTITAHVFLRCRAFLGSYCIAGNLPGSAEVFATGDFGWLCIGASGAFGRPVIFEDSRLKIATKTCPAKQKHQQNIFTTTCKI